MISGGLIIIEPWVPEDQVRHEVVVVGRALEDPEGLLLMADRPLGWGGWGEGRLIIVRPRLTAASLFGTPKAVVSGAVWGGRWRDPLRFIADLELEEPLGPPSHDA